MSWELKVTLIQLIFSSFQHVGLFKLVTHMTRSYNKENPNISQAMRTQGKSLEFKKNLFITSSELLKKVRQVMFVGLTRVHR